MDDNNDNDNNEENIKSKNIRRLLLLKTDKELKTKKKANFRINTKTIQELNKSYDLYNMLLSERTTIYFNYVKTEERIYQNNIKPINIRKMVSTHKKVEKPVKILNITTTIEEDDCSNSPINFFPQKIDFSLKRMTRAIIEAATKKSCDDLDLEPLQRRLQELLQGKGIEARPA